MAVQPKDQTPMIAPDTITPLRRCLEGLDLTSADGRAGLRCLLREIEAQSPGIIAQVNAGEELRRMGLRAGQSDIKGAGVGRDLSSRGQHSATTY